MYVLHFRDCNDCGGDSPASGSYVRDSSCGSR